MMKLSHSNIYNDIYDLILLTNRGNIKKINLNDLSFSVRTNRGTMSLKKLKKNTHRYIGSAFIGNKEPYVVEKKDTYQTLINDLTSYSEIVSNGKLYDVFKTNESLNRLIEITTNLTNIFSKKEMVKKQQTEKKTYEQIELF